MKVKICGIRRVEDAQLAALAGADAVGLLVGQEHASNDFISPALARSIARALPPFTTAVLVTHREDPEEVGRLVQDTGVGAVQIHSEMSPAGVGRVRNQFPYLQILKSFHVVNEDSLTYGRPYEGIVDGFVLDSVNAATGQVGGTGLVHDWALSAWIVEQYEKPVVLAGGLHPGNVDEAVNRVKPHGVDVNSGTKGDDGFKDPVKIRQFVTNAKMALCP